MLPCSQISIPICGTSCSGTVVFETMVVRTHSGDWAKGVVRLRIWSWERRTMLLGSWWWCADVGGHGVQIRPGWDVLCEGVMQQ